MWESALSWPYRTHGNTMMLEEQWEWRDQAACKGADPDVFFPSAGESRATVAAARKLCDRCPVQLQCREYVLTTPRREDGIWAGLTEKQRREIRRRRGVKDTVLVGCVGCGVGLERRQLITDAFCASCAQRKHREANAS